MSFKPVSPRLTNHPLVEEVEDDRHNDNGYWCYLMPGWINYMHEVHHVHEDTVAECLSILKCVEACSCDECGRLIARQ